MRTHFRAEQLANPALAEAEKNLRACVHCGICTATCPTYVLLGDERDSPRGRIVMMQQMLEAGGAPSDETVTHLDRCLSCLGCRTACPSGVDYARLIDQSRAHIERHYRRPLGDRLLRWTIATVLTRPTLTRIALAFARAAAPVTGLLPHRLSAMVQKAPRSWLLPRKAGEGDHAKHGGGGESCRPPSTFGGISPRLARGECQLSQVARKCNRRIALLPGCVQQAIAPDIDEAAARLLTRRGMSLEPLQRAGCCGALPFHLGREDEAKAWAKQIIEAFEHVGGSNVFDGILITATGCAAHIADYPHLFRDDPQWFARAQNFAAKLVQFNALLSSPVHGGGAERREAEGVLCTARLRLGAGAPIHLPRKRGRTSEHACTRLRVSLQIPCSLQHGLRGDDGSEVLRIAGFEVVNIPEGHLCCGSAGSYSILRPEIANALRARKLENIRAVHPDMIATCNIGCLQHLSGTDAPPVIHIAELLDWAEGGPVPNALRVRGQAIAAAGERSR